MCILFLFAVISSANRRDYDETTLLLRHLDDVFHARN